MRTEAITSRTFRHKFRDGNECEAMVDLASGITAKWSRRPSISEGFIQDYLIWMRVVMQVVADETGKSIAQFVQIKPCVWIALRAEPQCRTAQPTKETNTHD